MYRARPLFRKTALLIWLFAAASAAAGQEMLKEVTQLGNLQARHIQFYPDTKEWVLSDGYFAFKTDRDFTEAHLLFNSYPRYQFSIDRLPNKNYYSRHFDLNAPPFGYEIRTRKLDSSAFYIMGDSLKQVNKINPSSFLKVSANKDSSKQVMAWATNNCMVAGKDSIVVCYNGVLGIMRNINNKDSLYTIATRSQVTGLSVSEDGAWIAAGTRDSGWYFIETQHPDHPVKTGANTIGYATEFYFDGSSKHLWVVVSKSYSKDFHALTEYDLTSGVPTKLREFTGEDLGLGTMDAPLFAFNFRDKKLYIKSLISHITRFDLQTGRMEHELGLGAATAPYAVNQIYYNSHDDHLYLSLTRFDSANTSKNYLYRAETDATASVRIITPSNKGIDENRLYAPGISPAVNKLPSTNYNLHNDLADNGIALIQHSETEYLLYDIRTGNMIKSYRAANMADMRINDRYVATNRVSLSPRGNYIFEWMIKAGSAYRIADTLCMVLTQVKTGIINRSRMVLSARDDRKIESFSWNKEGLPVFSQTENGEYPLKKVSAFYLDSLLNPHLLATYNFSDQTAVLLDVWNLPGTTNMLCHTGTKQNEYFLFGRQGKKTVHASDSMRMKVLTNKAGFALYQQQDQKIDLLWFDTEGNLKNRISINAAELSIEQLSDQTPVLYLSGKVNKGVNKMDLLTGNITRLFSNSFGKESRYSFQVSADNRLLVSTDKNRISTWSIGADSLHQLYTLQTEDEISSLTQLTDRYIIIDGKAWNLQTGFMEQAGTASLSAVNDSLFLKTVYPFELLNDLGRDDHFKTIYRVKPYSKLFSKSLAAATDLGKWRDDQNNILIASGALATEKIEAIYELPLTRDYAVNIEIYPSAGLQNTLVLKKQFRLFNTELVKAFADTIVLLDLVTGKTEMRSGRITGLKKIGKDKGWLFLLSNPQTRLIEVYKSTKNGFVQLQTKQKLPIDSFPYAEIADEQTLYYWSGDHTVHYNLLTGITKNKKPSYYYLSAGYATGNASYYDYDEAAWYTAYSDGAIVRTKNDTVFTCTKYLSSANAIVGANSKYLVVSDHAGNYYFIDKKTLELDVTLYTWKGNSFADRKYLWLTRENYYMASPGVESKIHFVNGSNIIPLKQGDIIFNRPDKVLQYFKAPEKDIAMYRELYKIRASKYKIKSEKEWFASDTVRLQVSPQISSGELHLTVNASSASNISSLQVMVNGCPFPVKLNTASKQLEQRISIPLNAGANTIYTWAEDEKGNSSRYDEQKVMGEFADSGRWHFIGIGVSVYKDQAKNLRYADKDIRDLSRFLQREYPGIIIDTLLNESATNENIRKIARKLKDSRPDDKVFVSMSGHGLLDAGGKFWYATHDMNFEEPKQFGLSMDSITGMFENIPARYRMITLDACHSGDVVTSTIRTSAAAAWVAKDSTINGRGVILNSRSHNQGSSGELLIAMQKVFTDQLSNKGINLIAASSGTEFALEGDGWNNGVFTDAMIRGWSSGAKEDSRLHYRSFKQYVQGRVSAITGGKQTPNTVMENGELNWWLIPRK